MLQDKEALQQQLYSNKLQISALQSKLDETRHRFPDPSSDPNLSEQLKTLQRDLQSKEEQVRVLNHCCRIFLNSINLREIYIFCVCFFVCRWRFCWSEWMC